MSAKLAITCGDPAGIGPEIIANWLADHPGEAAGVAVIGPASWLASLPAVGAKIAVGLEEFAAKPGQPDGEGGLVAWAAMERAAAGCKAGEFSGVVTGPVSKAALAKIGYEFPGQTEFFAAKWGRRSGHGVLWREAPRRARDLACAAA
jgi:4-hydroxythreonine-4-phosphate dehydrogenase